MELFPFVAAFATFCFVWSYGIQKRRWWAWYLGWVFGALAALVIIFFVTISVLHTEGAAQMAVNFLFPGGAACVWIFWARWWARHRGEFYPEERRGKQGDDSDANDWE